MSSPVLKSLLVLSYLLSFSVNAQAQTTSSACALPSSAPTSQAALDVADGWLARVVAAELEEPRGIIFDDEGNLLVVQQGVGIVGLDFGDQRDPKCLVAVGQPTEIVADSRLNHGIELSADGRTLYASSVDAVYAWDYDARQRRVTSEARTIIEGMENGGHSTRTLLMSRKVEGLLLVSRGSAGNIDRQAEDITSGHCQIKAFNVTNATSTPYDFTQDGLMLGWGLRNSVGVAEDPLTGAIYSVENSVDNIRRAGRDIHEDNPGEELNFHGYLNGTETEEQGGNYGYPQCFAAWNVEDIPNNEGLQVGDQFLSGDPTVTINDDVCRNGRIAPRLTFTAHTAPLDIKFNSAGTAAWVTFHGSWNRDAPAGYNLALIQFSNGSPTHPANSTTAAVPILSNTDTSACPGKCFRPVGLAWDRQGNLFMSSDSTGEIFVISRKDGRPADNAEPGNRLLPSGTSGAAGPTATGERGVAMELVPRNPWAVLLAGIMALPLA